MTKVWRRDIQNCPINKRVHFLCDLNGNGNTLYEIIGTLAINPYNGIVTRGQCLEGDPDIFYKSAVVMWACYNTDEEAECLYR